MDAQDRATDPTTASDSPDHAVLAEVPPDRREFVKRMLVGAGMGLAVITSLYIPDVMAHQGGGRRSPNGYD
jgi:hypothetical protein